MTNRVSDSEKLVLEVLWQKFPLSSIEVAKQLTEHGWNEKTVRTFLNRLVKKNVVGYKKAGRQYMYSPLVQRKTFLREQSSGFLKRVFKGDMKELLTTFVQNKELSQHELEYLQQLLDSNSDNTEEGQ